MLLEFVHITSGLVKTHEILMCDPSSVDDLVVKGINVRDLVTFARGVDELARSFHLCRAENQPSPSLPGLQTYQEARACWCET